MTHTQITITQDGGTTPTSLGGIVIKGTMVIAAKEETISKDLILTKDLKVKVSDNNQPKNKEVEVVAKIA